MLRTRADALRMTVSGLRSLLDGGPREVGKASAEAVSDELTAALMDLPGSALRNIEFLKRATEEKTTEGVSSTDLAAALLAAVGRPVSMSQIRVLFEYLGWIDPEWKVPGSSIHMAVRHAAERGQARRLPDSRWVAIDVGKAKRKITAPTNESGGETANGKLG